MNCNYNNNYNLKGLLLPTCPSTFMATELCDDTTFTGLLFMIMILSILLTSIFDFILELSYPAKGAKSLKIHQRTQHSELEQDQQDPLDNSNKKLTATVDAQFILANDIEPKDFDQEIIDAVAEKIKLRDEFFNYKYTILETIKEEDNDYSIKYIPEDMDTDMDSTQFTRIEPIHTDESKVDQKITDQHLIMSHQERFFHPDLKEEDLTLMSYSEKARRFYHLTNHQDGSARRSTITGPDGGVVTRTTDTQWTGSDLKINDPPPLKIWDHSIDDHRKDQELIKSELTCDVKAWVDLNLEPHDNNKVIELYNEPNGNNQVIELYSRKFENNQTVEIYNDADDINQLIELFTDRVIESYKKTRVIQVEPEPPESLKLPKLARIYKSPVNLLTDLMNQSANFQITHLKLNHRLTSSYLNRRSAEESILKLKISSTDTFKFKTIPGKKHVYQIPSEIDSAQSVSLGNDHDNLMTNQAIIGTRKPLSMEQLRNILYIIT